MSAVRLLATCAQLGVTLTLEGNRIRVRGPRPARDELLPEIRKLKPELLAALKRPRPARHRRHRRAHGTSDLHLRPALSIQLVRQASGLDQVAPRRKWHAADLHVSQARGHSMKARTSAPPAAQSQEASCV